MANQTSSSFFKSKGIAPSGGQSALSNHKDAVNMNQAPSGLISTMSPTSKLVIQNTGKVIPSSPSTKKGKSPKSPKSPRRLKAELALDDTAPDLSMALHTQKIVGGSR